MLSQHVAKTSSEPEPEPLKTNSMGKDRSGFNNDDIYNVLTQNTELKHTFKKFLPCMAVISGGGNNEVPVVGILHSLVWGEGVLMPADEIYYWCNITTGSVGLPHRRKLPKKGSLLLIHDAASYFQRKLTQQRAWYIEHQMTWDDA